MSNCSQSCMISDGLALLEKRGFVHLILDEGHALFLRSASGAGSGGQKVVAEVPCIELLELVFARVADQYYGKRLGFVLIFIYIRFFSRFEKGKLQSSVKARYPQ